MLKFFKRLIKQDLEKQFHDRAYTPPVTEAEVWFSGWNSHFVRQAEKRIKTFQEEHDKLTLFLRLIATPEQYLTGPALHQCRRLLEEKRLKDVYEFLLPPYFNLDEVGEAKRDLKFIYWDIDQITVERIEQRMAYLAGEIAKEQSTLAES